MLLYEIRRSGPDESYEMYIVKNQETVGTIKKKTKNKMDSFTAFENSLHTKCQEKRGLFCERWQVRLQCETRVRKCKNLLCFYFELQTDSHITLKCISREKFLSLSQTTSKPVLRINKSQSLAQKPLHCFLEKVRKFKMPILTHKKTINKSKRCLVFHW